MMWRMTLCSFAMLYVLGKYIRIIVHLKLKVQRDELPSYVGLFYSILVLAVTMLFIFPIIYLSK